MIKPKAWDAEELRLAKAIGTGEVRTSDLSATTPLLKFFERDHWKVNQDDYELLLPSMRLASYLVQVGLPYLTAFLPSDQVHENLTRRSSNDKNSHTIPLNIKDTSGDLLLVRKELDEIAECTRWQVNNTMFKSQGWMGITRAVDLPTPWHPISPEQIESSDENQQQKGYRRRHLTVGIMGEYLGALKHFSPTSECHLRAQFLAAITITHEIGHAVYHQDFRSYDLAGPSLREPYVGDDAWTELGLSFIGFIFSGYNPEPIYVGSHDEEFTFDRAWTWDPVRKVTYASLYEDYYSIGIEYLEDVLSQAFWERLPDAHSPEFTAEAMHQLEPRIKSTGPPPAHAVLPEWAYYENSGGVRWKTRYLDRRNRRDPHIFLTREEVKWERQQIRIRYPTISTFLKDGRTPNPRLQMLRGENVDDPEEPIEGMDWGPPSRGDENDSNFSFEENIDEENIKDENNSDGKDDKDDEDEDDDEDSDNDFYGKTGGNPRTRTRARQGKPSIHLALQRRHDINEGRVQPTMAERMQQAGQNGWELGRITQPAGGSLALRPDLSGRTSSGSRILASLQDLEAQRTARAMVTAQIVAGESGNSPIDLTMDEDEGAQMESATAGTSMVGRASSDVPMIDLTFDKNDEAQGRKRKRGKTPTTAGTMVARSSNVPIDLTMDEDDEDDDGDIEWSPSPMDRTRKRRFPPTGM